MGERALLVGIKLMQCATICGRRYIFNQLYLLIELNVRLNFAHIMAVQNVKLLIKQNDPFISFRLLRMDDYVLLTSV